MRNKQTMPYDRFSHFLTSSLFKISKLDTLRKIAENPHRFIGIFRPTKPKAKILQNLLQSQEIRFGDTFELVIEEYLILLGAKILPSKYELPDKSNVSIDHCFEYKKKIYFVEQKIRDDHDSTKIRGQIQNFEKKLDVLLSIYKNEKSLIGLYFCLDPSMSKNKNFFTKELKSLTDRYGVTTQICYGKEFFTLLEAEYVWEEICEYLIKWREGLPDLPSVNFDLYAEQVFEEIKDLSPNIFMKLFGNEQLYDEIILTLFPQKKTLFLLQKYFQELAKEQTRYKTLYNLLENKL